jgi:hypothetical protein
MISLFGKHLLRAPQMKAPCQVGLLNCQRRFFDLHEYQSKYIMGQHGINVQKGALASTPEEAAKIARGLSNKGGLILKA